MQVAAKNASFLEALNKADDTAITTAEQKCEEVAASIWSKFEEMIQTVAIYRKQAVSDVARRRNSAVADLHARRKNTALALSEITAAVEESKRVLSRSPKSILAVLKQTTESLRKANALTQSTIRERECVTVDINFVNAFVIRNMRHGLSIEDLSIKPVETSK